MANIKGGRYVESLYFPIVNPNTGESHYPTSGNWRFNKGEINKLLKDKEIYFGDDGKGRPILKRFLCDVKEGVSRPTIWDHVGYNSSASKSIQDLLGKNVFDTPKPLTLMREIVSFASSKDDIILDFFAGSATLAQAVLELNREENMRLRFIMVQLPEPTYDIVDGKKVGKEGSSAFTAGYETVAEIGKERIRRVIEEIGDDFPDYNGDLGFKVFKLATSNMISWDETCEHGSTLEYENIKADRSDLDIMYELILKPKFDRIAAGLTAKIEEIQIGGCKISVIDDGVLVLCLSHNITLDVIEGIVKLKEKYGDLSIIFRDSGFASDTVKQRARLMLKDAGITRVKTV